MGRLRDCLHQPWPAGVGTPVASQESAGPTLSPALPCHQLLTVSSGWGEGGGMEPILQCMPPQTTHAGDLGREPGWLWGWGEASFPSPALPASLLTVAEVAMPGAGKEGNVSTCPALQNHMGCWSNNLKLTLTGNLYTDCLRCSALDHPCLILHYMRVAFFACSAILKALCICE